MDMALSDLGLDKWVTVVKVDGAEVLRNRLRAYGIVPGTRVCCRYRTPCGTVTALEARSGVVALRTGDMGSIRVVC